MGRSFGLMAYRAFSRRKDIPQDGPPPERPEGELVWLHAGEPDNLLAVQDLARRLMSTRAGLHVLITRPEAALPPQLSTLDQGTLIEVSCPGDHQGTVKKFLAHWRPQACLWIWGGLRPNLIMATADLGCPMLLVDAGADGLDARRDRWLPDLTRQLLEQFTAIFARSQESYAKLQQLGLPASRIRQSTQLVAGGQVLGCVDSDLDELSAAMGGRPAWFACDVAEKEIPLVLSAHQHALRLSHRLLLILQPRDPNSNVAGLASERNLTSLNWDDGEFPDDMTQLLISNDPVERGLFFRVAPVSFLGGTLFDAESRTDPLEAAALGSAILYGPRVRQFMPSYSRLAQAGAARIVNDADALGTAVSRLIAPDQAAAMAHAGWDVISQGAGPTDQVIDLVHDTLDQNRRKS